MTAFGAFAQIIPGVDGLIHISQIADHRIDKPQDVLKIGEKVNVKITNVDYDAKRISLSIRALLEEEGAAAPAEEAAEEPAAAEEAAATPNNGTNPKAHASPAWAFFVAEPTVAERLCCGCRFT